MKASAKSKQIIKNRTKLEQVLLIALLLIAWLFFAERYQWWPWSSQQASLGTAFYVVQKEDDDSSAGGSPNDGGGNGGGGGSNNGGGTGGSGGGSGSGGGGGTGGGSSGGSPLLSFAAGVDSGDTKENISGEASGIDESCAVLLNSTTTGKNEVCIYREGAKLITVTFLNDRVVSASRSGF